MILVFDNIFAATAWSIAHHVALRPKSMSWRAFDATGLNFEQWWPYGGRLPNPVTVTEPSTPWCLHQPYRAGLFLQTNRRVDGSSTTVDPAPADGAGKRMPRQVHVLLLQCRFNVGVRPD